MVFPASVLDSLTAARTGRITLTAGGRVGAPDSFGTAGDTVTNSCSTLTVGASSAGAGDGVTGAPALTGSPDICRSVIGTPTITPNAHIAATLVNFITFVTFVTFVLRPFGLFVPYYRT